MAELELTTPAVAAMDHSLLELPFSGAEFEAIRAAAELDLRHLLGLSFEHHVLFMQGARRRNSLWRR